jgi:thioredoxin 1
MKTLLIAMILIDGWDTTYQPQECSITWDTEIIPQELETAPADASPRLRLQFWGAPWCGACPSAKAQALQAANELGVELEYFNYDQNKALAKQLGIESVPQLHYIIDDKIIERRIGYETASGIVGKAAQAVAGSVGAKSDAARNAESSDVPENVDRLQDQLQESRTVSMQWSFEGNRSPTKEAMAQHLAEHGVNATGMTTQQMADTHDAIHNGQQGITTRRVQTVRRSGGRFFGLFGGRRVSCPGGVCP